MRIGIAYDLKADFHGSGEDPHAPDDRYEELDSQATVDAIAHALALDGHEPVLLGGGRRFLERVLADPPELVFNIAEGQGSRSREAHVPSVCEMLSIPFTHSDPLTLAVTLDKAIAKRLAASAGVPTPRFVVIEGPAADVALPFALPAIVKPLFEGSSMGIRRSSRVTSPSEVVREVERIARGYGEPALVEEFCAGPEYTIGILGTGNAARVIGAMEIAPQRTSTSEFVYSIEVKRDWENEVEYFVPPRQDRALVDAACAVALAAHRALGCRDVARVDVRLTASGEPRFLEVNPLPGLNPRTGDLCILAARSGVPYERLIAGIVESACDRQGLAV